MHDLNKLLNNYLKDHNPDFVLENALSSIKIIEYQKGKEDPSLLEYYFIAAGMYFIKSDYENALSLANSIFDLLPNPEFLQLEYACSHFHLYFQNLKILLSEMIHHQLSKPMYPKLHHHHNEYTDLEKVHTPHQEYL